MVRCSTQRSAISRLSVWELVLIARSAGIASAPMSHNTIVQFLALTSSGEVSAVCRSCGIAEMWNGIRAHVLKCLARQLDEGRITSLAHPGIRCFDPLRERNAIVLWLWLSPNEREGHCAPCKARNSQQKFPPFAHGGRVCPRPIVSNSRGIPVERAN